MPPAALYILETGTAIVQHCPHTGRHILTFEPFSSDTPFPLTTDDIRWFSAIAKHHGI